MPGIGIGIGLGMGMGVGRGRWSPQNVEGLVAWFVPRADAAISKSATTGATSPSGNADAAIYLLDIAQALALGPELWGGALTVTNGGGSAGAFNAETGVLSNGAVGSQDYSPRFVGPALERYGLYRYEVRFSGNTARIASVSSSASHVNATAPENGAIVAAALVDGAVSWVGGQMQAIGSPNFTIWTDGRAEWADLTVVSVSVRKISGNHAIQTTPDMRPTVVEEDGRRYVHFDGVNDAMSATLPDFGTDCTVAYSEPGFGAVIETGVTISGAYTLDSDFHEHLIFDGPLSAGDTARLEAYLNAAAGVSGRRVSR